MRTKREWLNAYLDQYPQLTDLFMEIIEAKSGHCNFDQMCSLAGYNKEERNKIDSAIPVDYSRAIEKVYPDFVNGRNCFSYIDKSMGEMVNINNRIVRNILKNL